MNVTTLFSQINGAYRGTDDDPPTTGTDFTLWLDTANRKISEWAHDTKNTWQSNFTYYTPNEPGTVTTAGTTALTGTNTYFGDYRIGDKIYVSGETVRTIATIPSDTSLTVTVAFSTTGAGKTFTHDTIIASGIQDYNLHRNLLVPSDKVFAEITATNVLNYTVGKPQEHSRYYNEVYISGINPQGISFYSAIASTDSAVGSILRVPGFYAPADLTAATDIVPVDDPYWLVYAVASELAFNDLTYESKTNDLNVKANNLYSQMSSSNRRGTNNTPRVLQTNVSRIIGPDSETGVGSIN